MNKTVVFVLVLSASLFSGLTSVQSVNSPLVSIVIDQSGNVNPSYAPVQRVGDTYFLRESMANPVVIKLDNIIFDGNGHTITGDGTGTAVNLVCSNVTIRNTGITNWETGVLGTYGNNTVAKNFITANYYGVAFYGDNCSVVANYLADNREGLHTEGSFNFVCENQFQNNFFGLMDFNNFTGNILVGNNFQNNQIAICSLTAILQVYCDNFINNGYAVQIIQNENTQDTNLVYFWDNGKEGNYWSNHSETPQYTIHANNPIIIDRYPLLAPVSIPDTFLPLPLSLPSSTIPPSITPTGSTSETTAQTGQPPNMEIVFSMTLFVLSLIVFLFSREHAQQKSLQDD